MEIDRPMTEPSDPSAILRVRSAAETLPDHGSPLPVPPQYLLATRGSEPVAVGPYELVAPLSDHRLGRRWLALHRREQRNCTLYRLTESDGAPSSSDAPDGRHDRLGRASALIARAAGVSNSHVGRIHEAFTDHTGHAWLAGGYSGTHAGLINVSQLAELKGGRLGVEEVRRGVTHLLEASRSMHEAGLCHGPIAPDDVLVDRHGALVIEGYGVARALAGGGALDPAAAAHEVRSIAALAYRLLTGLEADEPRTPADQIVKGVDRPLSAWIEAALHQGAGVAAGIEAAFSTFPRARRPVASAVEPRGGARSPAEAASSAGRRALEWVLGSPRADRRRARAQGPE